jgi:endo-1,4-beta-xylanase
MVGTSLTLTGTVNPSNATNRTITWNVQSAGTTGATINGNTLNTTASGTVSIRATIVNGRAVGTNYTQDFNVTVNSNFVPVTSITGVPTAATVGNPLTLTGTVNPSNATNRTITWNVQSAGTTGATISGNTLNTTASGTAVVRATIVNGRAVGTNYTQDFNITVSSQFVPVTNITGVSTTAVARTPLTLAGTVAPTNATNRTITWNVQSAGTTGATISGNTLNTTAAGTVVVRATIVNGRAVGTNYTQDFSISITASSQFVPVTNITGVPTAAMARTPLTLTGTVAPSNATNRTITWSVRLAGTTGATISGNTLNTTGPGTVSIRATIVNGRTASTNYTQDFNITVFMPVTNITGVPTMATVGTALTLTGTVAPTNATNRTITWSVQNAGTTGASISSNRLNVTSAGTVVVRATIVNGTAMGTNYIQDFNIAVFVPVTNITGVPTAAVARIPLTLAGTVAPSNATNRTITWSVRLAGTTGATISGNTLNTTGPGTVSIRATIVNGRTVSSNYTQDFNLPVFMPVTNTTGAPTFATIGTALTLSGTVAPTNATNRTITWSVQNAGTTGATISSNRLNVTSHGTAVVRATIVNGAAVGTNYTQDFNIAVFIPVTNITGVPTTATAGTPLTLSGTVAPSNASNRTITWSVRLAGTTGATISGNTLNTTRAGTVSIRATIVNGRTTSTNYTQDFNITIR